MHSFIHPQGTAGLTSLNNHFIHAFHKPPSQAAQAILANQRHFDTTYLGTMYLRVAPRSELDIFAL